jgi:hypothetical protein
MGGVRPCGLPRCLRGVQSSEEDVEEAEQEEADEDSE